MKAAFLIPALMALGMTSAIAGPLPTSATKPHVNGISQEVHYRDFRHCHWRHGHRWCHGGYRYYNDYGYSPGIVLRFGHFGHHHHHHGGHHH